MIVKVSEVLFRKASSSDVGALRGDNKGQYDVRLGGDAAIREFFAAVPEENPSPTGGWEKRINFVPFDGANPVSADRSTHKLRYMGPRAKRANDQYLAAQQPGSGYPLWEAGRAFPSDASVSDIVDDVVLIIRDIHDEYHARWVPKSDIERLPSGLQEAVSKGKTGIWKVNSGTQQGSELGHPEDDYTSQLVANIVAMLRKKHNVLLYGPPATGKTHIISSVRREFSRAAVTIDTSAEKNSLASSGNVASAWATFHQSYSYEDFLIGLRPETGNEHGFTLEPSPGALLELTEWARIPGNESLLIIDEINRGNVSKIFGEFITLMEPDKRLNRDGSTTPSTVAMRLPFIGPQQSVSVTLHDGSQRQIPNPFTMPNAVFTLATMNSVDKSVAPLDAALRRRFHVIELMPNFSEQRKLTAATDDPDLKEARHLGIALLIKLNHGINLFLGPDFQFGQWYLADLFSNREVLDPLDVLASIWVNKVLPQLEENFAGRTEQLLSILALSELDSIGSLAVVRPTIEQEELGAAPLLVSTPPSAEGVLTIIKHVVESS